MPGWLNHTLLERLAILWLLIGAPVVAVGQHELQRLRYKVCCNAAGGSFEATDLPHALSQGTRTPHRQIVEIVRDHELIANSIPHAESVSQICNVVRRNYANACKECLNTQLCESARRDCTGVLVT